MNLWTGLAIVVLAGISLGALSSDLFDLVHWTKSKVTNPRRRIQRQADKAMVDMRLQKYLYQRKR